MYAAIEAKAEAMAAKAKPGFLKHGSDVYTFVFNSKEWNYTVYQNGEWLMNVNAKSAAKVKSFLIEWLAN